MTRASFIVQHTGAERHSSSTPGQSLALRKGSRGAVDFLGRGERIACDIGNVNENY